MDNRSGKHCAKCDRPNTVDNLVGCDKCETWMHFGCAGVTDSIADPNRSWKCDRCHALGENSFAQSQYSVGHSGTSRHSSRIDLNLRLMEEQKAIRMRRILEEEAAQAAARKKIAEEEENFLKQKYALLLAEADGAEDGSSRRSRLSSRASREKVQSWLSEQGIGASQQVKVAQSSSNLPSDAPNAAQQSGIRASIPIADPNKDASVLVSAYADNIPPIVVPGPASTSTPNSAEDFAKTVRTDIDVFSKTRDTGKYVSHTEISIHPPPVSTALLTRSDSMVGINSFTALRPNCALPKNNSAPPSVNHPQKPYCVPPYEPVLSFNIPLAVDGNTTGFGNAITENTSARIVNITSSSEPVVGSVHQCASIEHHPFVPGNSSAPIATSVSVGLTQNCGIPAYGALSSIYNTAAVFNPNRSNFVAEQVGSTIPTNSSNIPLVVSSSGLAEVYSRTFPHPDSSVPVARMPMLSSSCNSTWMNSNLISTGIGGAPTRGNPTTSHMRAATINDSVPPPVQIEMPAYQPVSNSTHFSIPPVGQSQQPATVRRGPTNEQLAARQVMPRELPNFSGDPQDWPLFYSSFCNSTEACGFSDSENLARLQRCLKGNALEAVKSRLLMPQSVPFVIDILRRLYGRPEVLIHSLLQKLRTVSPPKFDNLQSQITFGLAVQNVVDHMTIANLANHLHNPTLLYELVEKLPPQLKMQWSFYKSRCLNVNLSTFSAFMSELVMMASDVTMPMDTMNSKNNIMGKEKLKLFAHSEEQMDRKSLQFGEKDIEESVQRACSYCAATSHEISECTQFRSLDIDGRWNVVKEKKLCRSCLVSHRKFPCRAKRECGVDGCGIHHHVLLHIFRNRVVGNTALTETTGSYNNQMTVVHQNLHNTKAYSLFRYLPVTIFGNGQEIKTYAFLDDGSSSTMIESGIATKLGIKGPTEGFSLSWTGNISREERESERVSIVVSGEGKKFKLHNVRTVKELQLPTQSLCYKNLQRSFPHLKGLPIRGYTDVNPGIIIGIEHARLLISLSVREGGDNEPVAVKTHLGWCIFGKQSESGAVLEQLNLHQVSERKDQHEKHPTTDVGFSEFVKHTADGNKQAPKNMRFELLMGWKMGVSTTTGKHTQITAMPGECVSETSCRKDDSEDYLLEPSDIWTVRNYTGGGMLRNSRAYSLSNLASSVPPMVVNVSQAQHRCQTANNVANCHKEHKPHRTILE